MRVFRVSPSKFRTEWISTCKVLGSLEIALLNRVFAAIQSQDRPMRWKRHGHRSQCQRRATCTTRHSWQHALQSIQRDSINAGETRTKHGAATLITHCWWPACSVAKCSPLCSGCNYDSTSIRRSFDCLSIRSHWRNTPLAADPLCYAFCYLICAFDTLNKNYLLT